MRNQCFENAKVVEKNLYIDVDEVEANRGVRLQQSFNIAAIGYNFITEISTQMQLMQKGPQSWQERLILFGAGTVAKNSG